jgi:hypothetical protein
VRRAKLPPHDAGAEAEKEGGLKTCLTQRLVS